MQCLVQGQLSKMLVDHTSPVSYRLAFDATELAINELLGQQLRLEFLGEINCCHCGRSTKKSFNQGYCYPCFQRLAQCDRCIMSPELCHFAAGTCREPEWGDKYCNVSHIVYLANSSNLKVGITRATQVPTRWMDQGAVQAVPIAKVATRHLSGLVEHMMKTAVSDKTHWQAMLKGAGERIDLAAHWQRLQTELKVAMQALQDEHGLNAITWLDGSDVYEFDYPVLEYPHKVKSFNLDKDPVVEGRLMGIKGQYLIFDSGVINLRKYTAYNVALYRKTA